MTESGTEQERHPALLDAWRRVAIAENKLEAFQVAALLVGDFVDAGDLEKADAVDELTELGETHEIFRGAHAREELEHVVGQAIIGVRVVKAPAAARGNGHDPEGLELEQPRTPLVPLVFPFPILADSIPRRQWIIPGLLLRRYVSVLVAPPGIGKSLLTLQIGMAACDGREWANWRPRRRPRVLFINSEDDEDEMRRRLYAAQCVMGFECDRDGLAFAQQPETIVIAKADSRTKTVVRTPMVERIVATVTASAFDMLIVDPFAETFEGDENSNSELKWAAVLWREIARRTNAGVLLVHHTKKYGAEAGNAESSRGGSALTGVARIVSTLFPMTEQEAKSMGVKAEDRPRFLRFDDAKANLTLVTFAARWFEKKTHTLPNAGDDEPADEVGVLVPWQPPSVFDLMDVPTANEILDALERGAPTGDPFCLKNTGNTTRWAGHAIKEILECDDTTAAKILKAWHTAGVLEEYAAPISTSKGKPRNCIRVPKDARPGTAIKA